MYCWKRCYKLMWIWQTGKLPYGNEELRRRCGFWGALSRDFKLTLLWSMFAATVSSLGLWYSSPRTANASFSMSKYLKVTVFRLVSCFWLVRLGSTTDFFSCCWLVRWGSIVSTDVRVMTTFSLHMWYEIARLVAFGDIYIIRSRMMLSRMMWCFNDDVCDNFNEPVISR